jgi:hypothetical protein
MTSTPTTTTAEAVTAHPYRRWRLAAGWGLVTLLAVHATWRGGLAFDLMFTIMKVVGMASDDQVLPFEPDWWGMLHRSAAAVLAAYVAWTTLRYQRGTRGACARCGRTDVPPRDPRRLAMAAAYGSAVPALAYAALKVHWGFGGALGLQDPTFLAGVRPWSPGMGDTAVMAVVGVAAALAMAHRRPRLPRWLLLTPAVAGLLLLLPVGVLGTAGVVATAASGAGAGSTGGVAPWVAFGIYPTFLVWGILLAIVTVSYHFRTRGGCGTCGRG